MKRFLLALIFVFTASPLDASAERRQVAKKRVTKKPVKRATKKAPKTTSRKARRGVSKRTRRSRAPVARSTPRGRRGIDAHRIRSVRRIESLQRVLITYSGCAFHQAPALRKQLLALRNRSQLMGLEVWGDTRTYRHRQKVLFYFRSPKPTYVTLFWIGPKKGVVIPIMNERIPAHRNVMMDSGGIIVPPFGLERWVAISTLEPIPLGCHAGAVAVRKAVRRMVSLPHGVGRWQVTSGPIGPFSRR